ncbi:ABC transporter permease subunit [Aeromicrobium massiliense]|uniref:ABC transporter permease subunit n=1 Tax=Aeromicrobium massiliense TaxID=1464554 RepID=UPI0003041907|nr:ABC transporter permease subunit [Aeromicrobium massiliense]
MTTLTRPAAPPAATTARAGFPQALRAEWLKLWSVRSTWWTVAATIALGGFMTILICALNAEWLASADADEAPATFLTWGLMLAQICAVVLGALVVTGEYSTGMVRTSFAAVPSRGRVMAAKSVVLSGVLLVLGVVVALIGYAGGNWFFEREDIGVALEGDMLRAVLGSGLFLAGIGLFTVAVGFILRHTAGTISAVLALMLIIGNMVSLLPGATGEWLTKLMPGNAGSGIAQAISWNPDLLNPWTGFSVFVLETAVLMAVAWMVVRRRDA